jgi:hypothetical protein
MPRHIVRDIDTCGLSYDQMMELWLGPSSCGSLFDGPEELQEGWTAARDEILRLFGKPGRRPQAWWQFDAPKLGLKWPGLDREQSYLYDHGILDEAECAELVRFWRREFDRDHSPAHLNWADVPQSLRQQWLAERPRRGRKRTEPALSGSDAPLKSAPLKSEVR